ncbi:MAG: ATP-grasp domain-containing protein [Smithella sp.]|nr:ATP-grasp domain-containing protein [Smithella sp.]
MNKPNLLITSAGRRTKLVEYFKRELQGGGKVITADCSDLAPALYTSDKGYIIPPVTDESYLRKLMEICSVENVSAVLSLIDTELPILAGHKNALESVGVKPIISDERSVDICSDKIKMHNFLGRHGFDNVKTFEDLDAFLSSRTKENFPFPVFLKQRFGSASSGAHKIDNLESLKAALGGKDNLIIQEFIDGRELGIDVYVDLISREIISIFIKEKFLMRSGETDKAVSVLHPDVSALVADFVKRLGLIGPLDMDVIEKNGRYFIIDVNSRFGGGYPLAYECGENYPLYIINNLLGMVNEPRIGRYVAGVKMMKHDDVVIVRP